MVYENDSVRVIHVHYGPHEKLPVHDHPARPTIYVYLSGAGPVQFSHVEQHAFKVVRPPVRTGAFRISPGRIEKHSIESLSALPSDFLRVELKAIPLGKNELAFRGNKPINKTKEGVKVEFDSPLLMVKRITTVGGNRTSRHYMGRSAGLLIAFVPVRNLTDKLTMKAGDVAWVPASFDLQPAEQDAHLLWITTK